MFGSISLERASSSVPSVTAIVSDLQGCAVFPTLDFTKAGKVNGIAVAERDWPELMALARQWRHHKVRYCTLLLDLACCVGALAHTLFTIR